MSIIDNKKTVDGVEYLIFDPSKNITALVISKVKETAYTEISKKIMNKEPQVEQVGFLSYEDGCDIFLHMAGGEFCGNATMCAAIYHAMENNLSNAKLKVKVYSIDELINVDIKKVRNEEWEGIVRMPKATEIRKVAFSEEIVLPVVFYSSIAHVIIDDDADADYKFIKNNAEALARDWCNLLRVPAIGLMHYDSKDSILTPLVYVKSVDTLFWENACASGTAAIGEWFYLKNAKSTSMNLKIRQPSGYFLETFANEKGGVYLKGKVAT